MGQDGHGFIGENNETDSSCYSLQKLKLYETQTRYYLIGRDKSRAYWRVLKIDRQEPSELNIYEDPATYTGQDINDLLSRLDEGNRSCGGIKFVTKAYGIVGFIKFLKPYYMILITKRQRLGVICGHSIFGIRESRVLSILHPSVSLDSISPKVETRYKRLFKLVDLSKGFFYSHTYQIMWSLQRNVNAGKVENMPFDDMFVWNSFLTRRFRSEVYSPLWTVALVHGFFKQVQLDCEGYDFTLTLIARRSRHFAGTRYLKRGVNAKGRAANDVETEQLVYAEKTDQICSIVQHRGSIPLFWSQETSVLTPKPDIILHKNDPMYEATELHFQNLVARYGNPIVVLNLVKTKEERPREIILCREYANAVAYLNHSLPKSDRIKFIQCDMHLFLKRKPADLLDVLVSIATDVVDTIGFYYSEKASENPSELNYLGSSVDASKDLTMCDEHTPYVKRKFQQGVLRSNCIDCLDRTNVSQYAFGLIALGQQMHALGLCSTTQIGRDSSLATSLMELYEKMGDDIALQYGGSSAHNKVFLQWQGKSNAAIQPQELFRSLIRHYNNAILDGEKQDAINIFLGHFRPEAGKLALWQMDSDNHLQIRKAGDDPLNDLRLSFKRSFSAGSMGERNSIASSQLSCHMNPNAIGLEASTKRGSTISEAELKKCLANDRVFSDVRRKEANAALVFRLYSSMYKSTDSSQGPNELTEADWLSSSCNSCEEDVQESLCRQVVTTQGSHNLDSKDSWLLYDTYTTPEGSDNLNSGGRELLSDGHMEPEESYNHDDYFQDFTPTSIKPALHTRKRWDDKSKEDFDDSSSAAETGRYSENFVNWIQEGHTLCF